MINLSSCSSLKESDVTPEVSTKIVDHIKDNYLEWRVENKDKEGSVTFSDGNIMIYNIRNVKSHKEYSNEDSKGKEKITLKPEELYTKKITLDFLPEDGEYEATFLALSDDDKSYKMIFNFVK